MDLAEIGPSGIVGDGHDDRKHHGGPERAVCLYASELITRLVEEGHPIYAGSAGENVTISGLDWSCMVPGVRVRLGATMIQLTSYTSPCKTIRNSFVNGRFERISQKTNPGWSRVYARVLVPGTVRRADEVEIVPG
ncbi:MAG: MOSC domain-containing protein [Gemmatimonadota bacterium]|nr:MOSC domain-containing protein [Gemmatimonadota bacterium]